MADDKKEVPPPVEEAAAAATATETTKLVDDEKPQEEKKRGQDALDLGVDQSSIKQPASGSSRRHNPVASDGQPLFSSRRGNPTEPSPKQSPLKGFRRGSAAGPGSKPSELTRLYQDLVPKLTSEQNAAAESAAAAAASSPNAIAIPGAGTGPFNEDGTEKSIKEMTVEEALTKFNVAEETGLSEEEAQKRFELYGPNAIPDMKENQCLKFLSFMWNPLSWVMEAAAVVAIALSNGPTPWLCPIDTQTLQYADPNCPTTNAAPDYPDFVGITMLLILNSTIGYYEESQAGAAVDALMDQLTREYKVKRGGKWVQLEAKLLVPGDILAVKLGDIVPADCKLLHGEPLKVDQAALTGESLPVTRGPGQLILSGSTIKQGEIEALVHSTGVNTESGKSQFLVDSTNEMGHLQQILTQIGSFCLVWIGIWTIILCGVLYGAYDFDYRRGIDMILVILIGGVPIAMPTVLSVTMAIGVNELAKEQAVVTRITAVEELAGMDVLCSDKTGTLTLNRLAVMDPTCKDPYTAEDILLVAALAARRHGDPDAIDRCIGDSVPKDMLEEIETRYVIKKFIPFDPVSKRTEAEIFDKKTETTFFASKGAPQIIINLAHNADDIREEQNAIIQDYAYRGLRALGVARSDDGKANWQFMGLISLSDPPRPDTKETIQAAMSLGVRVIMITGDQVAIGRETARLLGMGLNFHAAHVLKEQFIEGVPIGDIIEEAHGWGEVMPEDKYKVVQALRARGHLVGMTGDGVNDAPALKAADVGIAVADATDAARSAADMVLLTEGLSVIIKALLGSRCIFQRMRNYATYACATTIRIVTTFGLLSCIWKFTYPPFLVLIIAVLNDGTIMTVSTDRVQPSRHPDTWRLRDIFIMAFVLGFYLTLSSLVFFYLIIDTSFFTDKFGITPIKYNTTHPSDPSSFQLCGIMYLQVSITGQLIIFTTRAHTWFFLNRPSWPLMAAGVIAQLTATLIAVYGNAEWTQLYPIGWGWAAIVWVWSLIWIIPMDIPKMITQSVMDGSLLSFTTGIETMFQTRLRRKGLGTATKDNRSRSASGPNSSQRARRASMGK